jgi:uncharacterized protein YlzI (FlbEa/FlbD family)
MVSCRQTGLYIHGEGSNPLVLHNVFMVCKCPSIIIDSGVNAFVGMNEMQINDIALQLINNNSYIFENIIQKSIDKVTGFEKLRIYQKMFSGLAGQSLFCNRKPQELIVC